MITGLPRRVMVIVVVVVFVMTVMMVVLLRMVMMVTMTVVIARLDDRDGSIPLPATPNALGLAQ